MTARGLSDYLHGLLPHTGFDLADLAGGIPLLHTHIHEYQDQQSDLALKITLSNLIAMSQAEFAKAVASQADCDQGLQKARGQSLSRQLTPV